MEILLKAQMLKEEPETIVECLETLLDKEIIALAIKNDLIQAITSDNQEVQVDILN